MPVLRTGKTLRLEDFNQSFLNCQIEHPRGNASTCLSSKYELAKVNNYSLKEKAIIRSQFVMTPKQVSSMKRRLRKERSPNRNGSLITKGFTEEDARRRVKSSSIRDRFAHSKQSTLVRKQVIHRNEGR